MLGEKECCISPCTSTLRALIPVKTEDIFVVSDIISDIKRDLNHHQLQPPSIKLIHVAFTRYTGISSSRRGSSRPSPSNYRERLSVLSATKRRKGREREREGESLWGGICIGRKSRTVRLDVPKCRRNRCWEKNESLLLSGMRI